uniref:(northern house mosquito) hypothetical protein n=1 Tax=Culex pipiens TaxID=7175 RepID=A0A8D8KF84_CULPI
MRWKGLLLLLCAVALLDRTIPVRADDGDGDDVIADDVTEEPSEDQDTEVAVSDGEEDAKEEDEDGLAALTRVDEDAVEVDSSATASEKPAGKKGKYYNYDDFLSNLDTYDSNYDWNEQNDGSFWQLELESSGRSGDSGWRHRNS